MPSSPFRALILAGGWPGHQPGVMAELLQRELQPAGLMVDVTTDLAVLGDEVALSGYRLISPCWTMGVLTETQSKGLQRAVRAGAGLAGVHGGMGDAFRADLNYQWMVGGQFVGHPHVGAYRVSKTAVPHPITATLPATFDYESEQYYMLVDPAVTVLAETPYVREDHAVTMPVAWVRHWGRGRVFYHSLGHEPSEFARFPAALELTRRGLLWAAGLLD